MLKSVLKKEFESAQIIYIPPNCLVVEATTEYIPTDEFKIVFEYTGELVKEFNINRLVFDKRAMRVFDQPSMEWYFTEWKAEMADLNLTVHRKILPDDFAFRESVKVGRKNIARKYPKGKFHELDIKYAKSLDEALSI